MVSEPLLPVFKPILEDQPFLRHVVVSGRRVLPATAACRFDGAGEERSLPSRRPAPTTPASGSTLLAPPVRRKARCIYKPVWIATTELYGQPILGIHESDIVFSAAVFFAYGLGNGLSFPLSVGATTVFLSDARHLLRFAGSCVSTGRQSFMACRLFIAHSGKFRVTESGGTQPASLRVSRRSAAARRRPAVARAYRSGHSRWPRFHQALHIFLSNSPGDVRYGTSSKPVPGYGDPAAR